MERFDILSDSTCDLSQECCDSFGHTDYIRGYVHDGKKYSSQIDGVRAHRGAMPIVDVYLCAIPENVTLKPLLPAARNDEIDRVSNERVKVEKYCVWRLLEYALERSFGYRMEDLRFEKNGNGKWVCDKCELSLSHCDGAVAVAVSRAPVGIDVETARPLSRERFAELILTEKEKECYGTLEDADRERFLIALWTKKESLFKRDGEKHFSPSAIDTTVAKVCCGILKIDEREYFLSVATEIPESLRVYSNINIFNR